MEIPFLPPAEVVPLQNRGEMVVRRHRHRDPERPTLLLLHGWTANADTQFFTAYETLCEGYNLVAVDHRGHGRGLRPDVPFTLEDCADDAAAVVLALGLGPVVTVGYSMGGPISLEVWRRHRDLVAGMVFMATAMEWRATRLERARWQIGRVVSPIFRRAATPRAIRFALRRFIPRRNPVRAHSAWLLGEIRRNDPWMVSEAGRALSRFDARSFAAEIDVPTTVLLTTEDRLVPPRKQRQLATTLQAEVVELEADHFAPLQVPAEFAASTRRAVDSVASRLRVAR